MEDKGLLGVFDGHTFLQSLSTRHLMLLSSGVKPVRFAAEAYLGREGDPARSCFLIKTGRVALEAGSEALTVDLIGPGEMVGWSWLVPPHNWRFNCRAMEPVEALAFDAEWLRDKCDQDHELGYHLLKHLVTIIAGRLTATRKQLASHPKS